MITAQLIVNAKSRLLALLHRVKRLIFSHHLTPSRLWEGTVYFLEWSGVESWSGVMEWIVGEGSWSGNLGVKF